MTVLIKSILPLFFIAVYIVLATGFVGFNVIRPSSRSSIYADLVSDNSAVSYPCDHPLSLSFSDLSTYIGGSGKAKIIWEAFKKGIDPLNDIPSSASIALSDRAKSQLSAILAGRPLIPLSPISSTESACGTKKMLLRLGDGSSIESVLIPSYKYDRTTLCVSTQVGCDRGCVFCATGKMGLMRNLTSTEILGQVFLGLRKSLAESMPQMTNIVFMGMGDAGRNTDEVGLAVSCLSDRNRFSLAQSKVTVSSVGPSPEVFMTLAQMPCTLAWSLHAADDAVRKRLVPSTKHTTVQLRDGLILALKSRPILRHRTIMIAITLIDGVNDRIEDAHAVAEFVRPMLETAPKIALDLIPYNDIGVAGLGRPSDDTVYAFQSYLRSQGFFCSVRITRGDEDAAACGMLTTKNNARSSLIKSPVTLRT